MLLRTVARAYILHSTSTCLLVVWVKPSRNRTFSVLLLAALART